MALNAEFKINAGYGYKNETQEVPLSDISAAWEIENQATHRFQTKIIRASDGAEMNFFAPTEQLYDLFKAAGIPTIDATNRADEDDINYLLNLDHTALHMTEDSGAVAVVSAEGLPVKGSGAKLFYVSVEKEGYWLSPRAFEAHKSSALTHPENSMAPA